MVIVALLLVLLFVGYGLAKLVRTRVALRRVATFILLLAVGFLAGTGLGRLVQPDPAQFGFANVIAFWVPMVAAGFCAGMSTGPTSRPRRRFCVGVPAAIGVFIGAELASRMAWDPILLVILLCLFLAAFLTGMAYRETTGAAHQEADRLLAEQEAAERLRLQR